MDDKELAQLIRNSAWGQHYISHKVLEKIMGFEVKDSGQRRSFATGAVRDMAEGKGRFDLIPGEALFRVGAEHSKYDWTKMEKGSLFDELLYSVSTVLANPLKKFIESVSLALYLIELDVTGKIERRYGSIRSIHFASVERVAQLYENGAKKYAARNWEKGMPLSVYQDSMARHAFKAAAGWVDEDHLAAVCFNGLAAIHFILAGRDELNDLAPSADINTDYQIVEWKWESNRGGAGLSVWDIFRTSDGLWTPGNVSLDLAVEKVIRLIDGEKVEWIEWK